MVRCQTCGAEVSLRSRTCPRCGAPGPGAGARPNGLLLIALGACLAGGFVFASRLFLGSSPAPAPAAAPVQPDVIANAVNCDADWTKCADNAALMKIPAIAEDIQTKCREAGDRQSPYGTPEWPWDAFTAFRDGRGYIDSGIAVAIANNAQVETRSGGVVTTPVVCRYDLVTKTVLSLDFSRRLEDRPLTRRKSARLVAGHAHKPARNADEDTAE